MANSTVTTGSSECTTIDVHGHGNYTVYCMSTGQNIGLAFAVESGMISLTAVVILFALVVRNVQRHKRTYATRWRLIQRPMDAYMLALFILDFFQALGAVLDIRWANEGKAYVSGYCTAQGAIQQFGEAGSAIMTLIITVHTFLMICRFIPRINHSLIFAFGLIGLVYVFLILWVSIGVGENTNKGSLYMTPTPYWCWIGSKYLGERIAGEYIWLWLTLITSILVYVPLFLWSRGNLEMSSHWKPRFYWTPKVVKIDRQRQMSLSILAYPVAYTALVLPLTIIRWVTFADSTITVPSGWNFFAVIIFGFSGAVNVLLLRLTRPGLLLFRRPDDAQDTAGRGTAELNHGRAPSLPAQSSITIDEGMGMDGVPGMLAAPDARGEGSAHGGVTPPSPSYDRYARDGLPSASGSGRSRLSGAGSRLEVRPGSRRPGTGESGYELVGAEDREVALRTLE